MAQETLSRLAEEVKTLTLGELQELRIVVNEQLADHPEAASTLSMEARERLFLQHLLDEGIISHIPTRTAGDSYEPFIPIIVQGEPVSETVIRERR